MNSYEAIKEAVVNNKKIWNPKKWEKHDFNKENYLVFDSDIGCFFMNGISRERAFYPEFHKNNEGWEVLNE